MLFNATWVHGQPNLRNYCPSESAGWFSPLLCDVWVKEIADVWVDLFSLFKKGRVLIGLRLVMSK